MSGGTAVRPFDLRAAVDSADIARIHELLPELQLIDDPQLRDVVARLWVHSWRCSDWSDPAAAFMTIGNLPPDYDSFKERWNQIAHTRAVFELAQAMLSTFEHHVGAEVDHQVLFIAVLLHDVAKLVECAPDQDGAPVKTQLALILHHATVGAQWALEAGLSPVIAHAIAVHTPTATAKPETAEALVLKLADQTVTDVNRQTTWLEALTGPPKL
jgi:putative nucleotidyltransferase with HDIG domain